MTNGEPSHGIDANVPSETDAFEQQVQEQQQKTNPELAEAIQKLQTQLSRYKQFVMVDLMSDGRPRPMVGEVTVQQALDRAEINYQAKLWEKYFGIKQHDYINGVTTELESATDLKQLENHILITPDGVFKPPDA